MDLPIASDSVLGGIKVGQNLTIEADGTLNAQAVPTKTSDLINDSNFATVSQIPTKTSDITNDSGFITKDDIPEVPVATTTTAGKVIVGSGLSVDANGKIDALAGEETDPVFNKWLRGSEISLGLNANAHSNFSIAIGKNARQTTINSGSISIGNGATCSNGSTIAIGEETVASKYKSIAIGGKAKSNNQYSIQFGEGTNNEISSFQVYSYKVLDSDGNIPEARLSANTLVKSTPTAVLSGTYSDGSEFSFDVYIKQ